MARPQKKSIDYYPLDCTMDDSVRFIEAKHGIVGFGILVKLWSKIYSGQGYYCKWNEKTKYLFSKDVGVNIEEIESILSTCFDEDLFDKDLFDSLEILTSSGIQKRYFKIVKDAKRKNVEIDSEIFLLEESVLNSFNNSVNSGGNSMYSGSAQGETPQSKEHESTPNEKKEEESIEAAHPLQLFIFKSFPIVSQLQTQLSSEDCEALVKKFPKDLIVEKLEAMDNTSGIEKAKNSVNLTLKKWCEEDLKKYLSKHRKAPKYKASPKQDDAKELQNFLDIAKRRGIKLPFSKTTNDAT